MKADAVSVVEGGYAVDLPESEWVRRVTEAAWAAFGIGLGCTGYVYDATGTAPRVGSVHSTTGVAVQAPEFVSTAAEALPLSLFRELHAATPPVGTLNRTLGVPIREYSGSLLPWVRELESVHDFVGVRAGGGEHRGLLLTFATTARFKGVAPHTRRSLEQVAAHLAAAFRLRRVASALDPDAASAVLTATAKVEHLADDPDARKNTGALVDAVRRMEHARD